MFPRWSQHCALARGIEQAQARDAFTSRSTWKGPVSKKPSQRQMSQYLPFYTIQQLQLMAAFTQYRRQRPQNTTPSATLPLQKADRCLLLDFSAIDIMSMDLHHREKTWLVPRSTHGAAIHSERRPDHRGWTPMFV